MKIGLRAWARAAFIIAMGLFGTMRAQDEWNKKPFQQWSRSEAEKVLNNSPWARMQEVRLNFEKQVQRAAGSYSGNSAEAEAQSRVELGGATTYVDFQFTLRLRSALPVRQALVKLKQLEAKYDQMSEKDRAAFDAKTKGLLECPACSNNYVVTLSSKSKQSPGADAVFSLYKGGRQEDLQRYVYLANDSGERRTLVHFVPPKVPGDEATFFFLRFDDKGAPLFTESSKELVFNLSDNDVNAVTNFKIDVSKLILNGRVEF